MLLKIYHKVVSNVNPLKLNKMKLTKLQRHTAYIIMLQEFEEAINQCDYNICMCYTITDNFYHEYTPYWKAMDGLIELKRKQPKKFELDTCWFEFTKEGTQKRIELLKQCINETY